MKGDIASNPTYFTYDDISGMSPAEIKSVLQLKYPPTHYAQFKRTTRQTNALCKFAYF